MGSEVKIEPTFIYDASGAVLGRVLTKEDLEWSHAVRASQQALDDEKAALDDYFRSTSPMNSSWRQAGIESESARLRLEDARRRVKGWQEWFAARKAGEDFGKVIGCS